MVRTFAGAWPDNEPTVTSARAKPLWRRPGLDRELVAELAFPNGVTGKVATGMLSGRGLDIHATVRGTEGSIRIFNPVMPHLVSFMRVRGRNGGRRISDIDREPTYTHQLRAFRDAVTEGAEVITHPDWSVANMQVVDDCYRAAGMEPRPVTAPG
jgi:predicted dehydrogenase